MKDKTENTEALQKRDASADKKKVKLIFLVIIAVFAVLAIISALIPFITDMLKEDDEVSYNTMAFYEVDYNADVRNDALYKKLNRSIFYNRYGTERELTKSNVSDISPAAVMFYEYINCIINGDYANYPSFFTEEYKNNANTKLPESFTPQGLYDINITLHSASVKDEAEKTISEIYEVRYRIFKNDGTFRNDILPDETRTLVFEIQIKNGVAKITAIANRAVKISE